jgi:hypothetical protein
VAAFSAARRFHFAGKCSVSSKPRYAAFHLMEQPIDGI